MNSGVKAHQARKRTGARGRSGVGRALRGAVVALTLVSTSGCTDAAGYDLDYFWGNFPFLAVLRGTVAYKPYELPRLPAEGAIPVATPIGDVPPPFTQQELVANELPAMSNPLQPTPEVIERGNVLYQRHCMACHGPLGEGNGPVVGEGKFPFAPSVVTPVSAAHSDAYLYGIIRVGRGLMPGYGERVTHRDRWAMVLYMRELQRQAGQLPPTLVAPVEAVPESLDPAQPAVVGATEVDALAPPTGDTIQ